MARKIQTHELISFSIQDWTRGQRWGDPIAGDVEIDWTCLPSGGKRPWFLCPSCGRRCAVLYAIRSRIGEVTQFPSPYLDEGEVIGPRQSLQLLRRVDD